MTDDLMSQFKHGDRVAYHTVVGWKSDTLKRSLYEKDSLQLPNAGASVWLIDGQVFDTLYMVRYPTIPLPDDPTEFVAEALQRVLLDVADLYPCAEPVIHAAQNAMLTAWKECLNDVCGCATSGNNERGG